MYHFTLKTISRAQGRSATGAAAYRAGECIHDLRTGIVHDFRRKRGVLYSELLLPGGGTANRAEFWNGIEMHHKRGDAVPAREVEISLPTELTAEQRQVLAVGYARELADRYGVAADVALHAPRTITDRELEKNPDQYHETDPETGWRHNGNWHAHIMLSACHVQPDGTLGKKAVELDPIHCQRHKVQKLADRERPRWAELINAANERAGLSNRVDHRSLRDQGIDRQPTSHRGPVISAIIRKGGHSYIEESQASERLAAAALAGKLLRQFQSLDHQIISVENDIAKAIVAREQARRTTEAARRLAKPETVAPNAIENLRRIKNLLATAAAHQPLSKDEPKAPSSGLQPPTIILPDFLEKLLEDTNESERDRPR